MYEMNVQKNERMERERYETGRILNKFSGSAYWQGI